MNTAATVTRLALLAVAMSVAKAGNTSDPIAGYTLVCAQVPIGGTLAAVFEDLRPTSDECGDIVFVDAAGASRVASLSHIAEPCR